MPTRDDAESGNAGRAFANGLGRAIKVLRAERDLSRRDLAERSGLSYSYLAEIENGAKSPSASALGALATGLDLPTHELVERAETWAEVDPSVESPPRRRQRSRSRRGATREARPMRVDDLADEPLEFMSAMQAPPIAMRTFGSLDGADAAFDTEAVPGPPIPADLVDEIQAGNCVAFVGAGFSAAANLPPWTVLLERLVEDDAVDDAVAAHVASCTARGSAHALDEAAQLLEDALGRERFLRRLDELVGEPPMEGSIVRRVRWLYGIPFRSILTTNFDGVLHGATTSHEAYRDVLRPEAYRWWEPRYWEENEGAYTLKLHGDVSEHGFSDDSVVLTRRDYRRRLYEDPAYATFLRAIMATTTVLYLGFSFEDAYLNELRSEILALLSQQSESAPIAYAIVNDASPETRRHFSRHEGVEILSYDSQGGSDFRGFDRYLEAIYEKTNPLLRFARYLAHKRILWIDPHPENNELAFVHLKKAANLAGVAREPLVLAPNAEAGLRELAAASDHAPFDLVISHWGDGLAKDEAGNKTSTAEHLLHQIRARDLRCPVVVFGFPRDVENRKRTVLGLGAQAYCSNFEGLFQVIERVFAPGG